MEYIGAFEARSRFGELLSRIERGERIVITRNGRDVATLAPVERAEPASRDAFARLSGIKDRLRSEGRLLSLEEALSARDEGRP